eukprot:6051407-Prymnesium_polylepis.1
MPSCVPVSTVSTHLLPYLLQYTPRVAALNVHTPHGTRVQLYTCTVSTHLFPSMLGGSAARRVGIVGLAATLLLLQLRSPAPLQARLDGSLSSTPSPDVAPVSGDAAQPARITGVALHTGRNHVVATPPLAVSSQSA